MRILFKAIIVLTFIAPNANAIDCKKSLSKIELAICANESHLVDDKKLNELFNKAKNATKYPGNVRRSQLRWIKERQKACEARTDIDHCIKEYTQLRLQEFSIEVSDKANIIKIPAEIYSHDDYDILTFNYPLFSPAATPAQIKFNTVAEEGLNPGEKPRNTPPSLEGRDCNYTLDTIETFVDLSYSNDYLFLTTSTSSMGCGAAHPNHSTSINHWDMKKGEELAFENIFNTKNITPIIDTCLNILADEYSANNIGTKDDYINNYKSYVTEAILDIHNWSFGIQNSTISFSPYVAGSYAEGFKYCEIKTTELATYLQKYFIGLMEKQITTTQAQQ